METLRQIFEEFWVIRKEDRESYVKIRRAYEGFHRFITDQLGWKLIMNARVIKLEKRPEHAEPFMGIEAFKTQQDYALFCALLSYLEDLEDEQQFLLSEMVAYLEAAMAEVMPVDWTQFNERKALIRVLKFAEMRGLLRADDGRAEGISSGISHEVLYENTGLSRYFATTFEGDISGCHRAEDFEALADEGEGDRDRDYKRRNRVYRKLVTTPAMLWQESTDSDAIYLKNQRGSITKNLETYLEGKLQIHRNMAAMVLEEGRAFGSCHPNKQGISEVVLFVAAAFREQVQEEAFIRRSDDTLLLSGEELAEILSGCLEKYKGGFTKLYREMSETAFFKTVTTYLENWQMLRREGEAWVVYPTIGKVMGSYPRDFDSRKGTGNE